MSNSIKFGTDGWRAVIAEDFNFRNLAIISKRCAQWVKKRGKEICLGYDNRFMSPEYAEFAAGIIQSEGVNVDLSGSP
ncbi:MAG: phosphoglucomutase/phosphomannomutase family protein, partial [Elusimicrobiota bacterium]